MKLRVQLCESIYCIQVGVSPLRCKEHRIISLARSACSQTVATLSITGPAAIPPLHLQIPCCIISPLSLRMSPLSLRMCCKCPSAYAAKVPLQMSLRSRCKCPPLPLKYASSHCKYPPLLLLMSSCSPCKCPPLPLQIQLPLQIPLLLLIPLLLQIPLPLQISLPNQKTSHAGRMG